MYLATGFTPALGFCPFDRLSKFFFPFFFFFNYGSLLFRLPWQLHQLPILVFSYFLVAFPLDVFFSFSSVAHPTFLLLQVQLILSFWFFIFTCVKPQSDTPHSPHPSPFPWTFWFWDFFSFHVLVLIF